MASLCKLRGSHLRRYGGVINCLWAIKYGDEKLAHRRARWLRVGQFVHALFKRWCLIMMMHTAWLMSVIRLTLFDDRVMDWDINHNACIRKFYADVVDWCDLTNVAIVSKHKSQFSSDWHALQINCQYFTHAWHRGLMACVGRYSDIGISHATYNRHAYVCFNKLSDNKN